MLPKIAIPWLGLGRSKSFAVRYNAQMTQAKSLCYYSTQSPALTAMHLLHLWKSSLILAKIEFLWNVLQVQLRGLQLDLVIIFEPCSCSAGWTKGHRIGLVVTHPAHHQTWHSVTSTYFVIWRSCSTMIMRSNRQSWVVSGHNVTQILFDWRQRAFWQM